MMLPRSPGHRRRRKPTRHPSAAASAAALAGLVLLPAAAPGVAGAQERVGVASAVNPNATGEPPDQAARTLVLGNEIVFNETIRTQTDGQTQIVFLDRSSLSVGPASEVVIDKFVYDRGAGTGQLVASVGKGLFRYVGGVLSKNPDAVTIRTPTATIGVRGGVALISVDGDGRTAVTFVYGKEVAVTANAGGGAGRSGGGTVRLVRPGYSTTVAAIGAGAAAAPPSAPVQVPSTALAALTAQLDGRAGGDGGAAEVPSPVLVQQSGYAQANSADPARAAADAQSNGTPSSAQATAPPPTDPASPPQLQQAQTVLQQGGGASPEQIAFLTEFIRREAAENTDYMLAPDFTKQLLVDLATTTDLRALLPSGPLSADLALPLTGVASYSGSLVAEVSDGGTRSVTHGTFSGQYDFARGQPAYILLTNIGGRNFSTPPAFVPRVGDSGQSYVFLNGDVGTGIGGPLFGKFYDGPGGKPGGQVLGNFLISSQQSGGNFYASGFFGGTQDGYSDPFAPLTAFLLQDSHIAMVLPAGTPTPEVTVPTAGQVTFTGTVLAAVDTGGGATSQTSTYSGPWDFGTRRGTIMIGSLGGTSFSGSISAAQATGGATLAGAFSGTLYSGPLSPGGVPTIRGNVQGQFYDSAGVPAKQQAGSFALEGPGYMATGRFLGTR